MLYLLELKNIMSEHKSMTTIVFQKVATQFSTLRWTSIYKHRMGLNFTQIWNMNSDANNILGTTDFLKQNVLITLLNTLHYNISKIY